MAITKSHRIIPTTDTLRHRLLTRCRLRHWLGFARVAELGSVRKAADVIGIAQPALTSLLADLESLLGLALFERHARGMRLTPIGQELLPTARRLLGAVDDVAEQVIALQSKAQFVARVGAIGGAISGLLAPILPTLVSRHPELMLQLTEADAAQLDQLVARSEIDIALCRSPGVIPQGWRFVPILNDRFVVVAGKHHPLARRRSLTLEQLQGETWLAMPAGSMARQRFDTLFPDRAPKLCQISSRVPSVLWTLLKAQPLLALIPASVVRPLVSAGDLVELPVRHSLPIEPIGALVRADETRPGAEALLGLMRESHLA